MTADSHAERQAAGTGLGGQAGPGSEITPGRPAGPDGPAFDEPWQARSFAIALALQDRGLFSPSEWSSALGQEISRAAAASEPGTGDQYFHHWLRALERLVVDKQLTTHRSLAGYQRAWSRAASRTPHGSPIELAPQDFSD